MYKVTTHFQLFFSLLTAFISTATCASNDTLKKGDVAQKTNPIIYDTFINKMVEKHNFKRQELVSLLSQATVKDSILKAMSSPAEKRLTWYSYRKIFLKKGRIQGGVAFWNKHAELLEKLSKQYQVPAEIIVAIIGVETRYGANTGSYRVLDSLTTLGFHFPKRAKFFTSELEQFLLLCREEGLDPLVPKGSYAGAMGQSQFISSSYRHYAIDGNNDGKRDLWAEPADIIASIANYFAKHGWDSSPLITQKTQVAGNDYKTLINKKLKPAHSLQDLQKQQVAIPSNVDLNTTVKLLELQQKDSKEYWLAFHNFYVITRYNHSHLYAMAVFQLSQEIKNEHETSVKK